MISDTPRAAVVAPLPALQDKKEEKVFAADPGEVTVTGLLNLAEFIARHSQAHAAADSTCDNAGELVYQIFTDVVGLPGDHSPLTQDYAPFVFAKTLFPGVLVEDDDALNDNDADDVFRIAHTVARALAAHRRKSRNGHGAFLLMMLSAIAAERLMEEDATEGARDNG